MVKQTIAATESVGAQLPAEVVDLAFVITQIPFAWHVLEPDRVELQAPQTEHPLQRNGKIAPAVEIFRRKSAAEKNGHAERIGRKGQTPNTERSTPNAAARERS